MNVAEHVDACIEEVLALRQDFHRHPELGLQEFRTRDKVAAYLQRLDLEVRQIAPTGVVATMQGARQGPTLLMRADMDALPIQEQSGVPFSSVNRGVMHACGHDAHMAMLLGSAKVLAGCRNRMAGSVKFVFEPNEENAGALMMIREGVLENPTVDACLGAHVWTPLEFGKVGLTAGPVMAGMKHFELVVKGRGGHTAAPETAIDPILAASDVVQGVQLIQTRELDPLNEPALFMFATIHGGAAANIIPEEVVLTGTMRFMSIRPEDDPEHPRRRFERVVEHTCRAHRAEYRLSYPCGQPALVNDPGLVACARAALAAMEADGPEIGPLVTMAGEDFSEFSLRKPSVFIFLGAGNARKGASFPHHNPRFVIDEDVLRLGVEIQVRTALQYFASRPGGR
jgi:amidohydrolase